MDSLRIHVVVRLLLAALAGLVLACGEPGGSGDDPMNERDPGTGGDILDDASVGDDRLWDAPEDTDGPKVDGEIGTEGITDLGGDAWEAVALEHGGAVARSEGARVFLEAGGVRVVADRATGRFRVERRLRLAEDAAWFVVLDAAESRAQFLECPIGTHGWEAPGCAAHQAATGLPGTWRARADTFADSLGEGLALAMRHQPEGDGPILVTTFHLRGGTTFLTADLMAAWPEDLSGAIANPVRRRVVDLSVVAADVETGGALYLGPDPATHRLLDNGHDVYFDYESLVEPVGAGSSILFPPGAAANWVAAVADPASGASLVAGFLSNRRGVGIVLVDWVASFAPTVEDAWGTPRRGMTRFEGRSHYLEGRGLAGLHEEDLTAVGLGAAKGLRSELFYLEALPPSGQEGLEAFARRYAARIGERLDGRSGVLELMGRGRRVGRLRNEHRRGAHPREPGAGIDPVPAPRHEMVHG